MSRSSRDGTTGTLSATGLRSSAWPNPETRSGGEADRVEPLHPSRDRPCGEPRLLTAWFRWPDPIGRRGRAGNEVVSENADRSVVRGDDRGCPCVGRLAAGRTLNRLTNSGGGGDLESRDGGAACAFGGSRAWVGRGPTLGWTMARRSAQRSSGAANTMASITSDSADPIPPLRKIFRRPR